MQKNRIDIITLGCSKNLVDSEKLIRQFKEIGYEVYHDSDNVKVELYVIVKYGVSISVVAKNIIDTVKYGIEQLTGLNVKNVNVIVQGIKM